LVPKIPHKSTSNLFGALIFNTLICVKAYGRTPEEQRRL
jgi:hypothetical protein